MTRFLICCFFFFPLLVFGQNIDSLKPNKKPVKTIFFKKNLTIKNALLAAHYGLNKSFKACDSIKFNQKWQLTFSDNFDSLNLKKWRMGQPWGEYHPNHLHQYYSNNEIKVENGKLYLGGSYSPKTYVTKDTTLTIPYAVGLINSDVSFQQKYGYFEIRSKNPQGAATLPAFWLTGAHRWPPEIDIFEMYGGKGNGKIHNQYATVHWGKDGTKSRGYLTKKINLPNNTDTAFHVYACDWSPKYIKFYTDGKLVRYFRVNKRMRKWLNDEMVIIINNCFQREYLKYLPNNFRSNQFIVDWIRVYKLRR
jgi:beta-glucanase (GH16 family)